MLRAPKSAYSFITSSVRHLMTPARERVVLQSLPVEQQDKFTEDYCRGDMAVFEVEGVTFRVPKCLFEPGPGKFGPLLFRGNEGDEGPNKGKIFLPDLMADEFRALINFFLPYRCLNRQEPSIQHWINLLSISAKYELDLIIPIAIKGVDAFRPEVDPVDKYVLAVKYTVQEWEVTSFQILCRRPDPLTVEEAKKLGVVVATEIFRKREEIRSEMMLIANPTVAALAYPDSTANKPAITEVKAELSEDISSSPQPHHLPLAPAPPPVSGENTQVPSNQNTNDLATVLPTVSEPSDSNKPDPLGPASVIPQDNGHSLFCGASTSGPVFATKPTETQNTHKESTLPASASRSKFTFKQ